MKENRSATPENAKLCKSVNEDQIIFLGDLSWRESGKLVSDSAEQNLRMDYVW